MALSRGRRYEPVNYWPGFVDALSTMLLVIIFLLSVFMLAQFFLSREVTGKDEALAKLNRQIEELTNLLALERTQKSADESKIATLTATLDSAQTESQAPQGPGRRGRGRRRGRRAGHAPPRTRSTPRSSISARALAEVDVLNQQIAALRKQLAAIEDALYASEAANRESQSKIADLGQRLNVALAQKVQELNRYRSDFFGRLRQILGSRPDIRVVGDRFVFQSSVLFDVGKADISPEGKQSLDSLASAVLDLEREIPPDIPWILRVDGHTDSRPLTGAGQFKSNWELSAARAVSVVQYLVSKGVEPDRLAAAGFGEFQPIDQRDRRRGARPQPAHRTEADGEVSVSASRYAASKRPTCPALVDLWVAAWRETGLRSTSNPAGPGSSSACAPIAPPAERSWLASTPTVGRRDSSPSIRRTAISTSSASRRASAARASPRRSARCGETPRSRTSSSSTSTRPTARPAVLRTGGFSVGDAGRERAVRAADAQNALDGGRLTERAARLPSQAFPVMPEQRKKPTPPRSGGENAAHFQGENNHAQLRHPVALRCRPRGARDACPRPGHHHRRRRADDRPVAIDRRPDEARRRSRRRRRSTRPAASTARKSRSSSRTTPAIRNRRSRSPT